VPTVPGSARRIHELEEAREVLARTGLPVMIKAAAGGGGRGIRIARDAEELARLWPQARAEALAAFGDGGLYLEKRIERARHLEVQVLGDGRQVVHLGEGDALAFAVPVEGDLVAVSATNHKLLVFPLAELPEQAKGKGVALMRLKGAALADLLTTTAERGLVWRAGEQLRTLKEWEAYRGRRGAAGRLAPRGFPKDHRFGL